MTMSPKVVVSALLLASAMNVSAYRAKVVYGDDNRVLAQDSSNSEFREWSKATAAMIPNSSIRFPRAEDRFPDTVTIYDKSNLGEEYGLCKGETFSEMINPANCSGFLVEEAGEQYLITAGHCVETSMDCENSSWVFGFTSDKVTEKYDDRAFIPAKDVYKCSEVVDQVLERGSENDYAVIKLDRKVEGITPLKFRKEGKVDASSEMVVIGHPSGLPTIIDDKGSIRENENDFYFVANLDTFGGNSGSAVLNVSTGEVEGILVRGETDYEYVAQDSENGGCKIVLKCDEGDCRGEDVTRITNIELLTGKPGPVYVAPVDTNPYSGYNPWTDPDHWYDNIYNEYDDYNFLID
ncbi:serine protease [Halobacteriovorax sp. JY17]|uniref:trypsin-like serine peptidase n=1 Tax=Halobacteriovorax sp. JY17 TaxID=2014617 RepID=UPI000C5CA15D|nr:serine protease [Halobacteriovorax sp. JY17]PIK15753.1 MAG: endopeptidase [Halobacteriovorax sp. JY17]